MHVGVSLHAPNEMEARITVRCRVKDLRSMSDAITKLSYSERGAALRTFHDELRESVRQAEATVWGEAEDDA